jgi:hypothetical protein
MKSFLCFSLVSTVFTSVLTQAAPFLYQYTNNPPDILLGIRQTGGSSEMVVNIGPASRFFAATPGTTFAIQDFTPTQLKATLAGLDGVGVAVFGAARSPGDALRPAQTLWVTEPRADAATSSDPWVRQSSFGLGGTAAKITSVGSGILNFSSLNSPGALNTASAVVTPAGYQNGLSAYLGNGNFNGTFQGNVEGVTPSGFDGSGGVLRLDFYEIRPGSGTSLSLGWFDFKSDGSLTFTAAGGTEITPAPSPTITAVTRAGSVTTVAFTTVAGAQYTLLRAPAGLGTGKAADWTALGTPVNGTGAVVSITDTSDSDTGFYAVRATP